MQTDINQFEKINDHMQVMHEIQLRSSFKGISKFWILHVIKILRKNVVIEPNARNCFRLSSIVFYFRNFE